MDNLKYYDTSLAYNFDLFMPAEKKSAEVLPMPKKRLQKTKRKTRVATAKKTRIKLIAVTMLFIAMLCCNLVLRSQITETKS